MCVTELDAQRCQSSSKILPSIKEEMEKEDEEEESAETSAFSAHPWQQLEDEEEDVTEDQTPNTFASVEDKGALKVHAAQSLDNKERNCASLPSESSEFGSCRDTPLPLPPALPAPIGGCLDVQPPTHPPPMDCSDNDMVANPPTSQTRHTATAQDENPVLCSVEQAFESCLDCTEADAQQCQVSSKRLPCIAEEEEEPLALPLHPGQQFEKQGDDVDGTHDQKNREYLRWRRRRTHEYRLCIVIGQCRPRF
jgi:hypothetical protein